VLARIAAARPQGAILSWNCSFERYSIEYRFGTHDA
jgi:hypothetical protein